MATVFGAVDDGGSRGSGEDLTEESGASEVEGGGAECGPGDGGDGDGDEVACVTAMCGDIADAGGRSGEADECCEDGARQFSAFKAGDGDEFAAMEEDGERQGVGEDTDV